MNKEFKIKDVFFVIGLIVITGIIWALIFPGVQCVGRFFCL